MSNQSVLRSTSRSAVIFPKRAYVRRPCSRPRCAHEAEATLSFSYERRVAIVGPLGDVKDPAHYDLCMDCADRTTPPRGWQMADERTFDEPPRITLDDIGGDDTVALLAAALGAPAPSEQPETTVEIDLTDVPAPVVVDLLAAPSSAPSTDLPPPSSDTATVGPAPAPAEPALPVAEASVEPDSSDPAEDHGFATAIGRRAKSVRTDRPGGARIMPFVRPDRGEESTTEIDVDLLVADETPTVVLRAVEDDVAVEAPVEVEMAAAQTEDASEAAVALSELVAAAAEMIAEVDEAPAADVATQGQLVETQLPGFEGIAPVRPVRAVRDRD